MDRSSTVVPLRTHGPILGGGVDQEGRREKAFSSFRTEPRRKGGGLLAPFRGFGAKAGRRGGPQSGGRRTRERGSGLGSSEKRRGRRRIPDTRPRGNGDATGGGRGSRGEGGGKLGGKKNLWRRKGFHSGIYTVEVLTEQKNISRGLFVGWGVSHSCFPSCTPSIPSSTHFLDNEI